MSLPNHRRGYLVVSLFYGALLVFLTSIDAMLDDEWLTAGLLFLGHLVLVFLFFAVYVRWYSVREQQDAKPAPRVCPVCGKVPPCQHEYAHICRRKHIPY